VILEQKTSGLSISAFCRKRDVSQASFFNWRRRLTQRNDTAQKFIPVHLDAPTTATRSGCEVVLPDGCRIIVPTGCDANWLCEILEALRGSPSC
jgi:hypothetical protein